MLRNCGWLFASVGLVLAGCTGDEFLVGQDDGSGGAASSSTGATTATGTTTSVASSTTSTGSGSCDGCLQDGVCLPGNVVAACGANGAACADCNVDVKCATVGCSETQSCETTPAANGESCEFVDGDPASGSCSGGQCVEALENCLNGVDDDEDGFTDCLDPKCQAFFTCVDVPDTWSGPFAVYEGAVACPAVWGEPAAGVFGRTVTFDSTDCSACTCAVSACDGAYDYGIDLVNGENCDGTAGPESIAPNTCALVGASAADQYASAPTSTSTCDGTLPPDSLPEPAFEEVITVCGGTAQAGGGCDAGTCKPLPPASAGVAGRLCISQEGDLTCPAPFNTKKVVETGFVDGRACDCDCETFACNGELSFYTDAACTECDPAAGPCATLDVDAATQCADDLPLAAGLYAEWIPAPTCTTANTPSGEVVSQATLTFCCL